MSVLMFFIRLFLILTVLKVLLFAPLVLSVIVYVGTEVVSTFEQIIRLFIQ